MNSKMIDSADIDNNSSPTEIYDHHRHSVSRERQEMQSKLFN